MRLPLPSILVVALISGGLGCTDAPPPPHRGPVILITVDTLRADAVGALGGPQALTPNLDAFAEEAHWVEPAISTSSWTVPAMASIMTGLQPWRNGNWHAERARLDPDLVTLPEALRSDGFQTHGFRSNTWLRAKFGYAEGFERFHRLGGRKRATAVLSSLDGSPHFVWLHVLPPHAPYVRHDELLPRVDGAPANLPERVTPGELERWFDPGVELGPSDRERLWAMYRLNVAHSDRIVGELLEALQESGRWNDALVVVTSDHGEEFGENGQIAHGGNLHRKLVEVPLLIKLPADSPRRLSPESHVSNGRIFSTILELTGTAAAPEEGRLPSLFAAEHEVEPQHRGALAELYLGNGVNRFAWIEKQRQVVWESRFSDSSKDYYAVRNDRLTARDPELEERAELLFDTQRQDFLVAPPLAGSDGKPHLDAFRWTDDGNTVEVEGTNADARRLREAWTALNGADVAPAELGAGAPVQLTPEEIEELRNLGYVIGG